MVGVAGTEAGIMRKYGEFIELEVFSHDWPFTSGRRQEISSR